MKTNVKVNLGLNVLRRREDGYHDIETLFVPCGVFGDELEIDPSSEFSIEITSEAGIVVDWDPMSDLTAKAYRFLKTDFPGIPPVKIRLHKAAPVGAGLGGGSADAAFALRELNNMFALGLDETALAHYASRLGSDCAFFIYNRPMLAEGRGEILTPCPKEIEEKLADYEIKIIVPQDIHISTALAYKGIVSTIPEISLHEALSRPVEQWKDVLHNDFENTVFAAFPELSDIKKELYSKGAVYAAMSGSGSAVFGLFKKR
ncbi:MAG: 4-(cytidine 5'-diphospho)-2-C-methyl-D-erythritol kinase [Bacteroidales bacterium]|nr:4-(cytidine 5'-diphospho)-2-C-methyl-D-erythritol kinase [Bacteroidales bacterium]